MENSNLRLHIVSFNIPWPANYGGVMDVYYKAEALYRLGVEIILHCYEYEHNSRPTNQLLEICKSVYYYPRERGATANLHILPYNIYGRRSSKLLTRLLEDQSPILFEGLHSCYFLTHPSLRDRFKIVRTANVEHQYYWSIAQAETQLVSKGFHYIEALKFALYEKNLSAAQIILAVSQTDTEHYMGRFPNKPIYFVPCFHKYGTMVSSRQGSGDYILYHGKLSVAENEVAVLWLIRNVFSKIEYPVRIAGMNPSLNIKRAVEQYEHIGLIPNPDEEVMNELISQAHIHILWTEQPTGLKLKLLNSLFSGRHIIANPNMLVGSSLDNLCHIAPNAEKAISLCRQLMETPFTHRDITLRNQMLFHQYDTHSQALRIVDWIRNANSTPENL